jgi:hypothetical protein
MLALLWPADRGHYHAAQRVPRQIDAYANVDGLNSEFLQALDNKLLRFLGVKAQEAKFTASSFSTLVSTM